MNSWQPLDQAKNLELEGPPKLANNTTSTNAICYYSARKLILILPTAAS